MAFLVDNIVPITLRIEDVIVFGSPSTLAFTLQPQPKTVDEYSLATFSCEVTGGVAPYSYQWKKNGANVGTDSFTLSFIAAATDSGASITVVVTDSVGSVITSNGAVLSVMRNVVTFNGVSGQLVTVPKLSLINDSDFKFECVFVRADITAAGRFVFSTYTGNDYGINIYTHGDWVGGGGFISMFSTSLQSLSNKSIGVEYKVVVERVSGITTMKVNGVLESTTATFPPALYTATDMQIAAKAGTFQFHGKVKGLKIFNPINTLIRDYRMNDGWENNPVCANSATTGAAGNGTYIGLTSGSWTREVAS